SANLEGASLIGSDLSASNLKGANLKGAILVKSQLYHSNLDFVELTGAIIENWGIATDTSFKDVRCNYIYTRLPTENDRDPCRKPDNKNVFFEPGDFVDFITPFIKTLDLYQSQGIDIVKIGREFKTLDLVHHQIVDPSVLAQAFHIIAQKYPEAELDILSLEGEKDERVRIQAKVSNTANRSDIHRDYFETYNQLVLSSSSRGESLLARLEEKDQRIVKLEKLLGNALKQPKFYVETYSQGDFIVSQSKGNVNISAVQGNVSGIAAGETQTMTGVGMGVVSGPVTNVTHQSPSSFELRSQDIEELLTQLQAVLKAESQLSEEDKVEALEQVTILTEVGQNPAVPSIQKAARTALKILKGTVAGLSEETTLAQVCTQLFPMIAESIAVLSAPRSETAINQALPVKSILILAANPKGTTSLRLSEEARDLQTGLERSRYRDYFTIHQRWAVTTTDVRRALLDCKPSIVHFSGHGLGSEILDGKLSSSRKAHAVSETSVEVEGLLFENESGQSQLVAAEALADLFSLFSNHVECVVLNACFSEKQANAISFYIPYVVGMRRAIGDQAAIKFSLGFYDALLAGESVNFAYRLGCNAIQLEGLPESLTPVLKQQSV
ncbi:MAG: pentapeptide repeat-containing protein, partial [Cyanobacteria bacterium J06555_13]